MREQPSFCFIGNCQARNLSEVARKGGVSVKYLLVCSTDIQSANGIQEAKSYLYSFLPESTVRDLLSQGVVRINPSREDFSHVDPDTIVYTLFHEFSDYYIHKEKRFIVQTSIDNDIDEGTKSILLERLSNDFYLIRVDHKSYLDRFYRFIEETVRFFPRSKHIVVERIKNSDISGVVNSYLIDWDQLQERVDALYEKIKQLGVSVANISSSLDMLLSRCGEEQCFPQRIIKQLIKEEYVFKTVLDIEHPNAAYWNIVCCSILGREVDSSIFDAESSIELDNALIQSIRERDSVAFINLLDEISPVEAVGKVKILEAAVFVIGVEVYDVVRMRLEDASEVIDSFSSHVQRKVSNLLLICSNSDPLDGISRNEPIALWGAGGRCKAIIEKIQPETNIQCIFDSDPDKHGELLSGIPIANPVLWKGPRQLKAIIVTTTFFEEVGRSVARLNNLKGVKLINSTTLLEQLMAKKRATIV